MAGSVILRMSTDGFTQLHVAISLVGILSGIVVIAGLIGNHRLDLWTVVFLATTLAASLTGFLFPFTGITPGQIVGVVSIGAVAAACVARYIRSFAGVWRRVYVISCAAALYLNVFVAVVQAFGKIPALEGLAPTETEAPFAVAQLAVLVVFVVLGIMAAKRFRMPASGYRVI